MKIVIINNDNLEESQIDKAKTKVRALLTIKNQILVSNYGGIIMLPGGKLDKNETLKDALIRELKEETGIEYLKEELNELFILQYYQANYPTRENTVLNRLINTYFYFGEFKGIDETNKHMTEKEKKGNFSLQLIDIDELLNNLSINENPRSEFFNREISEAINMYKKYMNEQDITLTYKFKN